MKDNSKITFKKILKYIFIFLLLSFLISSLSGTIVVNAKTYTIDKDFYVGSSIGFKEDSSHPKDIAQKFNTPFKFKTDTQTNNSETFNSISFDFAFKDLEDISTITSNYLGYYSLHFKHYYDITKDNNFSFFKFATEDDSFSSYLRDFSIYDYQLYTSIDENGKLSYDEFIIFKDIRPHNTVLNNLWFNYGLEYSNMAHFYSYSTLGLKVPNLDSTYELYDAILTDDGTLPMTIKEYIVSSDGLYYDPDVIPYEDDDDSDPRLLGIFNSIVNSYGAPFGTFFRLTKSLWNYLLIPPEGAFLQGWLRNFDLCSEQFGILFLPFEILEDVLSKYLNLEEGSGIIHIPTINDPIYNQTIISSQDFNLKQIFSTGPLKNIHDVYLLVIDGIIVVALISLALKKFNSIFKSEEGGV